MAATPPAGGAVPEVKEAAKGTGRRDLLLQIQAESQQKWEQGKVFEVNAPLPGGSYSPGFQWHPFLFGVIQLEFASAYQRLCGKNVLFPQGFHCTGMPIKACADKLTRELEKFGCPPVFPTEEEQDSSKAYAAGLHQQAGPTSGQEKSIQIPLSSHALQAASAAADALNKDPTKFSSKKSKSTAKKGTAATQWGILQQSGLKDDEIPEFCDPQHWLQYFPPKAMRDMRAMGCGVDWRRSFITTDLNPYYDSFVQWQFWTLYKQGKITKDKRFAVFSPIDDQPCADHDRASGEGAGPQEYVAVKMEAMQLNGKLSALSARLGKVFLLAATLRPETMAGQTNAWVLPEGAYGAYEGLDEEVYICTERAAHNLSYQVRARRRRRAHGTRPGRSSGARHRAHRAHPAHQSAGSVRVVRPDTRGAAGGSHPRVCRRRVLGEGARGAGRVGAGLPGTAPALGRRPQALPAPRTHPPPPAYTFSNPEKGPVRGKPQCILQLTGQDLIGIPLRSPRCAHERIHALPLLTILMNKGTGIVTSVPSDSPDDYAALCDLKRKPKLREKYGVCDEWVMPFEVIPIIEIPGFGTTAAVRVCEDLKIQSQNDTAKLAEAKGMVYLKGFTDGVLIVGPYAGRKVSEAKPLIKEELLSEGLALLYSEPERQVISRSGDECVVALTDQWYMAYGEEVWQALTREALAGLEVYSDDSRAQFSHCLGWLQQWACSRSFGLGTRLPWDPQFLIESLSDSTVYMAYYTVAHILQGGDMYGSAHGQVKPEDMTLEVWNYVLLGGALPGKTALPEPLLQRMRAEFEYWYPFDLRVSGKDLIQNHLSFSLYNHTAIWEHDRSKWPKSLRCNGHLLLNSDKMSKSTGNFKTLTEAIQEYSADAMRWALADAGDGMDDANFETTTANAAILRMTRELVWTEEMLAPGAGLREGGAVTIHDRVFENEMNLAISAAKTAYDGLLFREALKIAAYDLQGARDVYRVACGPEGVNRSLVTRFIEVSALIMTPITPHMSEHIWSNLLKRTGGVVTAGWPVGSAPDMVLHRAAAYAESLIPHLRKGISKAELIPKKKGNAEAPPTLKVVHGSIYIAERYLSWQDCVLAALATRFDAATSKFAADSVACVLEAAAVDPACAGLTEKALKQMVLPFMKAKQEEAISTGPQVLDIKLPFDERMVVSDMLPYIKRSLCLDSLSVHLTTEEGAAAALATLVGVPAASPGVPAVAWRTEAAAPKVAAQ
ncbi:MAG: hypothetical protein WDW38_002197 [Sanguina aurantia]